ncbi:hypothetical protein B4072_2593 [Bacillus subtilis]|nr:hypothetical protein B4072_2593 [Bacillus subtilis]
MLFFFSFSFSFDPLYPLVVKPQRDHNIFFSYPHIEIKVFYPIAEYFHTP